MKKLDKSLFEFAEADLKEMLNKFIESTILKTVQIKDNEIAYYDEGTSDNVIMLIPSSNGSGDTFFRYIQELSKNFRVIVPFYRENTDLENQYKGLLELIEYLDIQDINVLGYSFGGVLAQLMAREHPKLIKRLILVDSETKTRYIHPKMVKRYVKSYKRLTRTLKYASDKWMVKSLKKRIVFDVKVAVENGKHFWEAFYVQILSDTPKERMKDLYSNVKEFWQDYEIDVADFESFEGDVYLLNVEGSAQRVEVQEVKHIFKNATEVVYAETFRMALVSCFDRIIDDVTNIIQDESL